MKVYVESVLDCPSALVWDEVQTSRLLLEVIDPLLRFAPCAGQDFPAVWQEGETVQGKAYAFRVLPLGEHAIRYERIDPERCEIQTREHSRLIRRWDHRIRVRATADGRALYSDEIDLDAGLLTLPVWLFAQWFYRHRQRRWRRVARRLTRTGSAGQPPAFPRPRTGIS
jgi:hypothetical protein